MAVARQGLSWEVAGSTGDPVLGECEARLLRCLINPQLWVTRNVWALRKSEWGPY